MPTLIYHDAVTTAYADEDRDFTALLHVSFAVYAGEPARTYGEPGDCHPGSSPEVDIQVTPEVIERTIYDENGEVEAVVTYILDNEHQRRIVAPLVAKVVDSYNASRQRENMEEAILNQL